jgi:AbrB family looped-hinge helix DNA binding protein
MSENKMPGTYFRRKLRRSGGTCELTIPKPITESLGWKSGEELYVFQENDAVIIKKTKPDS